MSNIEVQKGENIEQHNAEEVVSERRGLLRNLGTAGLGVFAIGALTDIKNAKAQTTAVQTITHVATVAELLQTRPSYDGQQFELLGYSVKGKGGGTVYYDSSDTTTIENNVTIFVAAGGFRFKRKVGNVLSVFDAGALGDGSNNDADAFQRAIDCMYIGSRTLSRSGGTIYIPRGDFRIDAPIKMKSGVNLFGSGIKATRLFSSISGFSILSEASPVEPEQKLYEIRGILFDGGGSDPSAGASRLASYGIDVSGMSSCVIRDCMFERFLLAGITSSALVVDCLIEKCFFQANACAATHDGASGSTEIKYYNCYVSFSDGFGIYINNVFKAEFHSCIFERNYQTGLYLDGAASGQYTLNDCYFENNGYASGTSKQNLFIGALGATVNDSYFTYNANSGSTGYTNIFVGAGAVNTSIIGCFFNGGPGNSNSRDIDASQGGMNIYTLNNHFIGQFTQYTTNALSRIYGDNCNVITGAAPSTEYRDLTGRVLARHLSSASWMDFRHDTSHRFTDLKGSIRAQIDKSGLYLAGGGWNTAHIQLGGAHLWVDGSARLRIKFGVPTSDLDGSVVGLQS